MVEYIARHTLRNGEKGEFSERDLLNVSEIALIVDDVPDTSNYLSQNMELSYYGQSSNQFAALGDENGLILFMKTGRKLANKLASISKLNVSLKGERQGNIKIPDYPYELEIYAKL